MAKTVEKKNKAKVVGLRALAQTNIFISIGLFIFLIVILSGAFTKANSDVSELSKLNENE